jgi:hypothetical protein
MSEPRIALVAEGVTDRIIVEAALRAILKHPFTLTLLQPEATQPEFGGGWGGVLKWCDAFRKSGFASLEADPRRAEFDLIIVHLDADVANKTYADYGLSAAQLAADAGLMAMPFALPCPPASGTVARVEALVCSWLGLAVPGAKTAFCIPSKSTEAWLAAALLHEEEALMANIECEDNVEGVLARLPRNQRVRKSATQYQQVAGTFTRAWATHVRRLCPTAAAFELCVSAAIP